MMVAEVLLLVAGFGSPDPPGVAEPMLCTVTELRQNPDGYRWPVNRIEEFVDEAPVIARAVASGVATDRDESGYWSTVQFRVLEVIRGPLTEAELLFPGRIAEKDDFNPGSVPYQIVRLSGHRGDCHAREYRVGAEYLFLLEDLEGELTPYWAPLAPTNEQIEGADDPWLAWVRGRVE